MRIFLLAMIVMLTACENTPKMKKERLKSIDEVEAFESFFECCYYNVGKHKGDPGPLVWLSKAVIYDRYVVSMIFNYNDKNGSVDGDVVYRVYEYSVCDKNGMGGYSVSRKMLGSYDEESWKTMLTSKDEFISFFQMRKGKPLLHLKSLIEKEMGMNCK